MPVGHVKPPAPALTGQTGHGSSSQAYLDSEAAPCLHGAIFGFVLFASGVVYSLLSLSPGRESGKARLRSQAPGRGGRSQTPVIDGKADRTLCLRPRPRRERARPAACPARGSAGARAQTCAAK
ncbi:hypothetical protein NDU88_002104 [Pleurodeles waltl]|uniref:Uncharacterized protein n=1 Tax=Pleurodeles waltl TaxID=8319 RepID=A0AAV7VA93_PLEWA|nr:hypothetical protein NDU88_002104 [Pleurodeles waltl]